MKSSSTHVTCCLLFFFPRKCLFLHTYLHITYEHQIIYRSRCSPYHHLSWVACIFTTAAAAAAAAAFFFSAAFARCLIIFSGATYFSNATAGASNARDTINATVKAVMRCPANRADYKAIKNRRLMNLFTGKSEIFHLLSECWLWLLMI